MPLTTPKIFCQADTSDIFVSIKEIRAQFPDAPVFAVGFSLGGYTLNKYVGQVDTGVYSQGALLAFHHALLYATYEVYEDLSCETLSYLTGCSSAVFSSSKCL